MSSLRFRARVLGLACLAVGALRSSPAAAQHVGGSMAIGDAHALSGWQSKELGDGPVGQLALQLYVTRGFGFQLEGTLLSLGAKAGPDDPRLATKNAASLVGGELGVFGRPFVGTYDGKAANLAGLWMDAGGGPVVTGKLLRAAGDAHVGWDFWLGEGFGVGPALGLEYVHQPKDTLRPDDAAVGMALVHATWIPLETPQEVAPPKPVGDRDYDGVLDDKDLCPDDPEDKDGFDDADGCPDTDNDRDGIVDAKDKCPNEPEDKDGFEDGDGCPDTDNDRDGIADAKDRCPLEPEDFDGFEDDDGCPEADNDKDGIPDVKDECPNEPETVNGFADEDGCPDEDKIRVVGDQIVLDERIYFHVNLAKIQTRSYPLLHRLAKLLLAHPEYVEVSIEGHADRTGETEYNLKLSEARAQAVKERLVMDGVDPKRLRPIGYGESRPAAEGSSQAALRKNRRVEFRITRALLPAKGATK